MSDSSRIDELLLSEQSFTICAFPDEEELHFFISQKKGSFENESGDCFIISPEGSYDFDKSQKETSKDEHRKAVSLAIDAIRSGELQKVIISTIKHSMRSGVALSSIFEALCSSYPTAFRYLCSHPTYGLWMGASPELLIQKKGNHYFTTSLAGTVRSGGETPVWSQKLIDEQKIVTQGIQSHLKAIGVEKIYLSETRAHIAGPVTHLKTDIDFTSEIQPDKIVNALHPTAAVCGLPKEKAKELYHSLESHKRKLYTGYLGVKKANGDLSYFVNLRCMQIFKDHFEIFVGGGITADSIPDEEWAETENKAKVLRDILYKSEK